jgi:hypothetical protein
MREASNGTSFWVAAGTTLLGERIEHFTFGECACVFASSKSR